MSDIMRSNICKVQCNDVFIFYKIPFNIPYEKIEIDEIEILSREHLVSIIGNYFNIPKPYLKSVEHIKIFLLNKSNKPVLIIWHNFLLGLDYLGEFLLEFCQMLVDVSKNCNNLKIVGIK